MQDILQRILFKIKKCQTLSLQAESKESHPEMMYSTSIVDLCCEKWCYFSTNCLVARQFPNQNFGIHDLPGS